MNQIRDDAHYREVMNRVDELFRSHTTQDEVTELNSLVSLAEQYEMSMMEQWEDPT